MKHQILPTTSAEIMTVHELALYLKTSDAKVYRMARTHDLPGFRIGKSWRFKKIMIDMWIRQKIQISGDPPFEIQFHLYEKNGSSPTGLKDSLVTHTEGIRG
jgi:excisionase family DNA binding protein